MKNKETQLYGAGPWVFGESGQIPDIEPGDSYRLDFSTLQYNGSEGWFRQFLPLSDLQITNESSGSPLKVRVNDQYGGRVPANSVEPYPSAEVVSIELINLGSDTLQEGDVIIEVAEGEYTVDEQARERKGSSVVRNALSDLVPGL